MPKMPPIAGNNDCKLLAGTAYLNRHYSTTKIIHQGLALEHHLTLKRVSYYQYHPEILLENTTLHTD